MIRHRRYFVAAYIARLAPVPADDRAIAAALAHARELLFSFRAFRATERKWEELSDSGSVG